MSLLGSVLEPVLVPVLGRFVKSWPDEPSHRGQLITYKPLARAMLDVHADDAHFCAYSVPSILRRLGGRSLFDVLDGQGVRVVLFVLDVEPDGHAPVTPEWWAAERAKLDRLEADQPGGFVYRTRGGYRVVYELGTPIVLHNARDAENWKRQYAAWLAAVAARYEIAADPTCKDWTRLYRLPFVVRDGVAQTPEVFGDAECVGAWTLDAPYDDAPEDVGELSGAGDLPPASPELITHIAARLGAIGPAIEGQGGDNKTFSVCATLLHGYGLTELEAWPLLSAWNQTNEPPWSVGDLRDKMTNAERYAKGTRGADRAEFEALDGFGAALAAAGVSLSAAPPPEPEPSAEYPDMGDVLGTLALLADTAAPAAEPGTWAHTLGVARGEVTSALGSGGPKQNTSSEPFFRPMLELLAEPPKPTPWLVRGLLTIGGVSMIGAEPKSTKTWIAMDLALSVASGLDAVGEFKVPHAGRVAYFFAEDQGPSIVSKVRAFAKGRGVTPEDLARNFYAQPRGRHIDVTKDEDLAHVVASVRAIGGVRMIVIDPLRDVHSGGENESDDMSDVMARLRVLSTLLDNATVLVVHHAKKPSKDTAGGRAGNALRGSSVIYAALDALISVGELEKADAGDLATFTTEVTSEVKGAKSAGTFQLTLSVVDNADGQATCATWKHSKIAAAKVEETADKLGPEACRDIAVSLVDFLGLAEARGGKRPGINECKTALKVGQEKVRAGFAAGSALGWMSKNASDQWVLTETGRALAVERAAPVAPAE